MQTTTIKTTSDYRETCTLTTARNPATYSFIAKSKWLLKRTIKIKILKNDNTHYADMESILFLGQREAY